ncbi:hypothetical protein FRACYDRAFT_245542 [Fragilariopsis cylindrus CCMP1102]|uniref:Alpha-type protein kinase domain-containing protein n=1 Tax=Fragilariopsis cylindrus CCMP1102 TaxID=635003 RepID=A0A1E7EZQ6_9STRA|nr:hypothetical protein FRACYDRAFT_245542 [Fragilariopsis cylindrus CCMP1102]|eukprot:OEU11500.1 hypothetical protein FRACYDRAFT_245542 [Fragilariopsis cylindrus CCMP1102]
MVNRYCCSSCNRRLPRDSFSNNQWRKGEGRSRCHACVNSGPRGNNNDTGNNVDFDSIKRTIKEMEEILQRMQLEQIAKLNTVDAAQTARTNNATHATFKEIDLQNPFAQGSFRWVAKGVYSHGSRAGEACVCKWFKTGGVVESSFYDIDLSTVKKALDLITKWNSSGMVNKMVKINQPAVWTFDRNSGARAEMICDLQGGYYNDGVILTDPVILSLARKYGPTDLGSKGISNFFGHHTCNEFCRSEWRKPIFALKRSVARKGTTMEEVPTGNLRIIREDVTMVFLQCNFGVHLLTVRKRWNRLAAQGGMTIEEFFPDVVNFDSFVELYRVFFPFQEPHESEQPFKVVDVTAKDMTVFDTLDEAF